MVSVTIILTYRVISANMIVESNKNKKMSERKITPRYVEVTPGEALELFKTSNEEVDAARSRLMAKYALQTAENVPIIGVIMGDRDGQKIPARMIDLNPADLGTTLNPNKHIMPHPRQVEPKKAETIIDTPQPLDDRLEQPPLQPEDDLEEQPVSVDERGQEDSLVVAETPVAKEEIVSQLDEDSRSHPEAPRVDVPEVFKEKDEPLALTKELTKEMLHDPQAYFRHRESLIHVLSGQYASELEGLRGGPVSDEILDDIRFATAREAREIKSEIGRLDKVNERASELLRDLDTDLRNRLGDFNDLERDIKKDINSYTGLVNTLSDIATGVEKMMRDLRITPIYKSNVEEAYSTILHQQQTYEHYYRELFKKDAPDTESLYASFRGPSLEFEDNISTIRRLRDQEEVDTLLSTEEVADRVIGLGAPASVNILRSRVDDKIEDTIHELSEKHKKAEEVVTALGGIRAEESLWDKSNFPDEAILSSRMRTLISALNGYLIEPSPSNLIEVKEKGAWLQREMLDEGTLRRSRTVAGSNTTLLQKLSVARNGIDALQL